MHTTNIKGNIMIIVKFIKKKLNLSQKQAYSSYII